MSISNRLPIVPRSIQVVTVVALSAVGLLALLGWTSAIPLALVGGLSFALILVTGGMVQNVAIATATLSIAFCLLECVAISVEPKIDGDGGIGPRPIIGWGATHPGRFRVVRTVGRATQFDRTYTIDAALHRKVDSGTEGKGVAFFGDSFVFGTGVDDAATLPQLFADDTGRAFPVFNMGVPGWSPANVLAELQSGLADDELAKTRLVVEFVAPWHAERTGCDSALSSRGPRYRIVGGTVERAEACPAKAASRLAYFAFDRVFVAPHLRRVSDDDMARLVAITQANIRLFLAKYQAPVVVYYLREPAYTAKLHWTDEKIMAAFTDAGAQVLDYALPDDPRYRISGDGHPTALANRIRAERLTDFVRATYPAFNAKAPADETSSR